jgi:uncharacterized protein (TIGR02466 family)
MDPGPDAALPGRGRNAPTAAAGRKLETSDVIPMFPTLVWKLQVNAELRDRLGRTILATLAGLRRGHPALEPGRGWQSEQALHRRDELLPLVECINRAARGVLSFLRIDDSEALQITACWATVLAPGATHKPHSHPNNFLSGVYYVCTHPGADAINFHDPRRQSFVIRPPVVELTAENTDQVVVRVCDGTLLLFPSFLEHSVDANASREERISISFNVMFASFAERLSKPLW